MNAVTTAKPFLESWQVGDFRRLSGLPGSTLRVRLVGTGLRFESFYTL